MQIRNSVIRNNSFYVIDKAIWKSCHLRIGIGNSIDMVTILILALTIIFWKNSIFILNTPQYSLLRLVTSTSKSAVLMEDLSYNKS